MTYSALNDERAERFCPMHGEVQAFTAPYAGYTKEPGCVCPMLPLKGSQEPEKDGLSASKTIRDQIIDAIYDVGYSHDSVEAVRRLIAKGWAEGYEEAFLGKPVERGTNPYGEY